MAAKFSYMFEDNLRMRSNDQQHVCSASHLECEASEHLECEASEHLECEASEHYEEFEESDCHEFDFIVPQSQYLEPIKNIINPEQVNWYLEPKKKIFYRRVEDHFQTKKRHIKSHSFRTSYSTRNLSQR